MKGNKASTGKCYSLKFNMEMETTYKEIAGEFGVTIQAIQQTETKALSKFKKRFCQMFPDTWPLIEKDIIHGYFGR